MKKKKESTNDNNTDKKLNIDAQWEITKALREQCRKSYGEPMGIDAEEEMMKALRNMS